MQQKRMRSTNPEIIPRTSSSGANRRGTRTASSTLSGGRGRAPARIRTLWVSRRMPGARTGRCSESYDVAVIAPCSSLCTDGSEKERLDAFCNHGYCFFFQFVGASGIQMKTDRRVERCFLRNPCFQSFPGRVSRAGATSRRYLRPLHSWLYTVFIDAATLTTLNMVWWCRRDLRFGSTAQVGLLHACGICFENLDSYFANSNRFFEH